MPQRDYVFSQTGLASFFRAPAIAVSDLPPGSTGVLGVPMDSLVLGPSGQRDGPRSIRVSSLWLANYYGLRENSAYLDIATGMVTRIPDKPQLFDIGDADLCPHDIRRQTEMIISLVAEVVERAAFPVLLGGDHYLPYPGIQGLLRGLGLSDRPRSIGYLVLDSHTDFWDEFRGLGRYHHGTAARRISELPGVANIVFYGLGGSLEPDQLEEMHRRNVVAYPTTTVQRRGAAPVMSEALAVAGEGVEHVYVSCDIDVVDGAHAPGTHSMVFGGLSSAEYLAAMSALSRNKKVRALDLCETLPARDVGGERTARLAAMGLMSALGPRVLDVTQFDDPEHLKAVFR